MGYNGHMPHVVVFSHRRYGGMEMYHLHTEQGVAHVRLLLGHLRSKADVGDLMRISWSYLQLELGTSAPALT